jgi:hypothetical protein
MTGRGVVAERGYTFGLVSAFYWCLTLWTCSDRPLAAVWAERLVKFGALSKVGIDAVTAHADLHGIVSARLNYVFAIQVMIPWIVTPSP